MKSNKCNTECACFKWSEQGANYKAFCTKENTHICNMTECPGMEMNTGMNQNEM